MSHPKLATPDHEIHDLIRQRWSPRAFDDARAVPREELLRLFEAARWAPSSGNEQPWRFVVTDREQTPEQYRALHATLTTKNQAWAGAAPVLVLLAVRETYERDGAVNTLAGYDAGQAMGFLSLQATAQGLSIRQMEGFDRDAARAVCALPAGLFPAVVIAIGHAGDPDRLSLESHRSAERQPRRRKPVSELVFWGRV
jgi:nitroreductase